MYEIEYLDDEHLYLINGVITPSVTQLLKKKFGGNYDNVPQAILNAKASFGQSVHKYIEQIEEWETPDVKGLYEEFAVKQYLKLKEEHKIDSIACEMLVHCEDKYAGRLDMIADVNLYRCLLDVKTTYKLDKEYLSWQLSLYEYALRKMGYKYKIHKFYCVWLPKKNLGQLVEIEKIPDAKIEEFLMECEE